MKNRSASPIVLHLFLPFAFSVLSITVAGQQTPKISAALPDSIAKIVSNKCMPCHSSEGGFKSRVKLNFSNWGDYSEREKTIKAQLMYKKLSKNEMPPKNAREKNPKIIPTSGEINIIKNWSDTFTSAR